MLSARMQQILSYEMTVAEWIGAAVLLGVPYLVVGVIWTITHISGLSHLYGIEWLVSLLGAVAAWPVLLFPNICTA